MCYDRLEAGQTPACVQACPEGAIEIEVVNKNEWLSGAIDKEGNAPGLVDARLTGSTTRWTLPKNMPDLTPMDKDLIKPAHKELPLVFMTVLTQVSLIGFIALLLGDIAAKFTKLPEPSFIMAFVVFALSAIGLPLSALHLGRPILAMTAMKNLKTSWLSREALFLGLFTGGMTLTTLLYYLGIDGFVRIFVEIITAALGIYGIYAQSMIYRVPAKPTWNRVTTTYRFFATGYIAASLLASIALFEQQPNVANILLAIAILLGSVQLFLFIESQRFYEKQSDFAYQIERAKSLLENEFKRLYHFRKVSLPLAALLLPLFGLIAINAGSIGFGFLFIATAIILGFASELVGRVLFYATAIKTGMPGNFFAGSQRG